MSLFRTLIGGAIAAGLAASPAWADRPRDQDRAFEATRHGRSMPLPKIEQRVMRAGRRRNKRGGECSEDQR